MSYTIRYRGWLACLCILVAAGCTAPSPASSAIDAAPAPPTAERTPPAATAPPSVSPRPAPPMSGPLPAERVTSPLTVDRSCQVDADCAVKNVGNCCGAMPACVNKDSPTDPAAVQAECARKGMASICGFKEIAACTCNDNQCTDAASIDGATTR